MNIYKVLPNDCDYDECISVVVVAPTAERALEIAELSFTKTQHPLVVEQVSLDEEQIVETSILYG